MGRERKAGKPKLLLLWGVEQELGLPFPLESSPFIPGGLTPNVLSILGLGAPQDWDFAIVTNNLWF